MTINEIRESGLLELYAIGTLEGAELELVQKALDDYPELKEDIRAIEKSLFKYANAFAMPPSASLKENLMEEIGKASGGRSTSINKKNSGLGGLFSLVAVILALLSIALGYFLYDSKQELKAAQDELAQLSQECDSLQQKNQVDLAAYQALSDPDNEIIAVSATPKYPETDLYFYHNETDGKNYIRLSALPTIDNATQSYQLWSLKGNDPPIPLDVFQFEGLNYIEVQHVSGTNTYAITIEPKGGQQSPTLENLIGTFTVS